MDNGSVNNIDETAVEQIDGNREERTKPVNRLLRGLMIAAVIASATAFIYLLVYFTENTGV